MNLSEIKINERYDLFLRVISGEVRMGKNGLSYLSMRLTDGIGFIDAKQFNFNAASGTVPENDSIIKVRARASEYNGHTQLVIEQIRPAGGSDLYDAEQLRRDPAASPNPSVPKPAANVVTVLSELHRDEKFEGYLLVRSAEQKPNASGKNYLDMTLCDKSGTINGKMWDGTVQPPKAGSVILVKGTGNEFNGRIQMRVTSFEAVRDLSQVDMSSLVPCAPEKAEDMMNEIRRNAEALSDPDLRSITCELLDKAGDSLITFPAAKQMHHAERSGLLHHMTTMLRGAAAMCTIYPYLNRSLLFAGVIVHDLAKISEMDTDALGLVSDYSVDGKLLGHIVRGVVDIELAARKTGASPAKALLLQHMVLSHHGIPEFGSPIAPKFPEAEVLNTLDTLDARLFEMTEALGRAVPGGFSEKVWGMDNRQLYRIPEDQLTADK